MSTSTVKESLGLPDRRKYVVLATGRDGLLYSEEDRPGLGTLRRRRMEELVEQLKSRWREVETLK